MPLKPQFCIYFLVNVSLSEERDLPLGTALLTCMYCQHTLTTRNNLSWFTVSDKSKKILVHYQFQMLNQTFRAFNCDYRNDS